MISSCAVNFIKICSVLWRRSGRNTFGRDGYKTRRDGRDKTFCLRCSVDCGGIKMCSPPFSWLFRIMRLYTAVVWMPGSHAVLEWHKASQAPSLNLAERPPVCRRRNSCFCVYLRTFELGPITDKIRARVFGLKTCRIQIKNWQVLNETHNKRRK